MGLAPASAFSPPSGTSGLKVLSGVSRLHHAGGAICMNRQIKRQREREGRKMDKEKSKMGSFSRAGAGQTQGFSEWVDDRDQSVLGAEPGSSTAVSVFAAAKQQVAMVVRMPAGDVAGIEASCASCKFPLLKGKVTLGDEPSIGCSACGTTYSLLDGKVVEYMPKKGPTQWL